LPALQLAHLAFVELGRNVEPVEENRGIGFRGVTAFFADNPFKLA